MLKFSQLKYNKLIRYKKFSIKVKFIFGISLIIGGTAVSGTVINHQRTRSLPLANSTNPNENTSSQPSRAAKRPNLSSKCMYHIIYLNLMKIYARLFSNIAYRKFLKKEPCYLYFYQ